MKILRFILIFITGRKRKIYIGKRNKFNEMVIFFCCSNKRFKHKSILFRKKPPKRCYCFYEIGIVLYKYKK